MTDVCGYRLFYWIARRRFVASQPFAILEDALCIVQLARQDTGINSASGVSTVHLLRLKIVLTLLQAVW